MKIIIAGDGDTGCHLARQLCAENQDVVLIGEDRKRLEELDSRNNIMVQYGSGVMPSNLKNAGVAGCDLFVSVSPWGNENIVSSQLAKALGAGRTVARIDNGELITDAMRDVLRHTGIDIALYPEYLVAHQIRTLLKHNWVKQWFELHDGALVIVGVKVRPDSELAGMHLYELMKSEHPFHVAAHGRMDRIDQGMAGIDDIRPHVFIHLGFKGKEGNGQIRILGNGLAAALVPGPDGRQDIIDDGDARRFGHLDEAHVEARIVDADQDIGLFFTHRIDEEVAEAEEKGNLADDFPDADDA